MRFFIQFFANFLQVPSVKFYMNVFFLKFATAFNIGHTLLTHFFISGSLLKIKTYNFVYLNILLKGVICFGLITSLAAGVTFMM